MLQCESCAGPIDIEHARVLKLRNFRLADLTASCRDRRLYVSFILADKFDKGVPCAAVQPCLFYGTSQDSHSIQLLPVCMCCVL